MRNYHKVLNVNIDNTSKMIKMCLLIPKSINILINIIKYSKSADSDLEVS